MSFTLPETAAKRKPAIQGLALRAHAAIVSTSLCGVVRRWLVSGEADGGSEARARRNRHRKRRCWRRWIATPEIKVALRLRFQSLSPPRAAASLVVGCETPVTVGQVKVHLGVNFTGSEDLHDPEERPARDKIEPQHPRRYFSYGVTHGSASV